MEKRKKTIFFSLLVLFITFCGNGMIQAAVLKGSAPTHVGVGEQFQVSYTISSHDVSDIRLSPPDGLKCIYGPTTSTSSSFQMINGKTSSNESTTFTFIFQAERAGTFTLPAASCSYRGQKVSSNKLVINVSGKSQSNGNITPSTGRQPSESYSAGRRITGSDLFILVSADKKQVYEQEPVLLTYKVYTLARLNGLDGKMPDLKNFHVQEIELPQQKNFAIESYKGKRYKTVTWSKYLIFPQVTGSLTVPSITFTGTVVQENTAIDPLEALFNGGAAYTEVQKKIVAPSIDLKVLPLPERPKDFSGGVGSFTMEATLKSQKGKTFASGEPMTLHVVVKGNGNMKLMKQPVVEFPKDFDRYDAKVKDATKLTEDGISGMITYDFLAVPRHKGKFTIPSVKLVYFDTQTRAYKTLKSQPFEIDVRQGKEMTEEEQETLRLLNTDIRHIKLGEGGRCNADSLLFGSLSYWLWLIVSFVLFVALLIVFRKRAIEAANISKMRGKRANKVATKKLRKAEALLREGRQAEFYDEVLRALWGYAGDKLNMPVEDLSKENISEKFSAKGTDGQLISQFIDALDDCEFARFAPGDAKGNMNKTYDMAASVISKIEKGLAVIVFLLMSVPLSATTKAEADSAYNAEDYTTAIRLYKAVVEKAPSADVYYNLGNAYYRCDSIPRAVLNYERALLFAPGDADIRFNLEVARRKTTDRIVPEGEMFFVGWYKEFINMTSSDGWSRVAIITFIMMLALAMLYVLAGRLVMRKVGFFGAILMLAVFILANIFAAQQKSRFQERRDAIVMSAAVSVKSTPADNGTDLFVIHEGTKVSIIDESMKDWKEIRLADGKVGWIKTSQMERI